MTLTGPLQPGHYIVALGPDDGLTMAVANDMAHHLAKWGVEICFVETHDGALPLLGSKPPKAGLTKGSPASLRPSPWAKGFWEAWVDSWMHGYSPMEYWKLKETA